VYVTSSPAAAQTISFKHNVFHKPTGMFRYQAINIFGLQIVSAQTGHEHRRHKSVVRGCFGESVMENGFNKILEAMDVMVREEKLENGGVVDVFQPLVIKVSHHTRLG
jgi:cytochrome P450